MKYTVEGYLEPGLHSITANEFIDAFCKNGNRAGYEHAVTNIFDFAKGNGATNARGTGQWHQLIKQL